MQGSTRSPARSWSEDWESSLVRSCPRLCRSIVRRRARLRVILRRVGPERASRSNRRGYEQKLAVATATQQQQRGGVYLWPRRDHWHFKPPKRAPGEPKRKKAKPYVKYMGHGGCGCDASGRGVNPGCISPLSSTGTTIKALPTTGRRATSARHGTATGHAPVMIQTNERDDDR